MGMKRFIRQFVPLSVLCAYHRTLASLADIVYGHPSRTLVVIGVTGTKGKTTTSYLIAKLLEAAGLKSGLASTALFKVGAREWLNATKMTMLGRFRLQRLLREMVHAGVTHTVIETSSEGILQSRHRGIWYDVAVFTNLSPDHLEAHGSFESYRAAKGELFRAVMAHEPKTIGGRRVERLIVANKDDAQAGFFLSFPADKKIDVETAGKSFEEKNVAIASAVVAALGVADERVRAALPTIPPVPGRMEKIDAGQPFTVIVDYAHEPASFQALYDAVAVQKPRWIIHVFGATGGGRDRARRPAMGEIAARYADRIILTNDDPYDDDPRQLAMDVRAGIPEEKLSQVAIELDRRKAIETAIREARAGDLVLITGKGSEQTMVLRGGKTIPWDDRKIAYAALQAQRG